MPENHEKSEVISDQPTDIVNYRVACTRLKRERGRHCKENKSSSPLLKESGSRRRKEKQLGFLSEGLEA